MNIVGITGNLVRDPELRNTSGGNSVANITMAVDDREKTAFVDVTLWGQSATTFCDHHVKGDRCAVEGRISMDEWEDKTTGAKRTKLKVTAERWTFVKRD